MRAGDALQRMEALPFADLDEVAPGTSLILAPHPDDESLGCGGLIAALCDAGRPPVVVCVTDGTGSHPGSKAYPPPQLKALREQELLSAVAILGLGKDRVRFLGLPDTRSPQMGPDFEQAVHDLTTLVRLSRVTTLFATWHHDPHCDHQASAVLAEAVARSCGIDRRLYPVWGWLLPANQTLPAETIHGFRLDITEGLHRKRQAIATHASQYSDLIIDDPDAFRLPAGLLAVFDRSFEVFLQP
jgi:LmbE family N-acetylglucosaminyl deacetylase